MIGEAVDRATDRIGERVSSIALSYALKVSLAVIALLFWMGVLVCGCIAAFWALQPAYGPMQSLGIVAAVLAILGLATGVVALRTGREVSLAGTVEPAAVVEEEVEEVVDTVGPYRYVAGALAVGALLGSSFAGPRAAPARQAANPSLAGSAASVLSMVPSVLSIVAMLNARAGGDAQDPARNAPPMPNGASHSPMGEPQSV